MRRAVSDSILDHWDMWSSRNVTGELVAGGGILDHWDMWSSRNAGAVDLVAQTILDHWDMWSSRNMGYTVLDAVFDFRSLGYVV